VFGWLCQRRQDSPIDAWLAGSVGLFLVAFALNRIAFVNYFAIPMALMLFLILSYTGRRLPDRETG
jgi:energy-converting hydrogenase Eha subunit G